MDTRASIESILDKAYAARQREDYEGAMACFTEDGCFKANGSPGTTNRTEQAMALKATFDQFALLEFHLQHDIERVGEKLRAMMPWIKQRALVDKSRN